METGKRVRSSWTVVVLAIFVGSSSPFGSAREPKSGLYKPVPHKVVVLTFDDSSKTHWATVRPILKRYGFGATFFITEGFQFATDKKHYMSWDEIAQLHRDGFEIGNHTRDHLPVTAEHLDRLADQLAAISDQCAAHGIPRPVSFAYPGNSFSPAALQILSEHGIRWARRGTSPERPYPPGRGIAYQIGLDHPLLIPTAGDARPGWSDDDFRSAVSLATAGRIAVLQFHGVPDQPHPWVSSDPEKFARWMKILKDEGYQVIALKDLERFVPEGSEPNDPEMVMKDRRQRLARHLPLFEARLPKDAEEWRHWARIMDRHGFAIEERMAATGADELTTKMHAPTAPVPRQKTRMLEVLPYPGGRHPRLGFRDGAIRPQRETKLSVFLPSDPSSYVVLDVPEAIWMKTSAGPRLLYLAHTHVPTIWDDRGDELEPLEWKSTLDGGWRMERTLPNGVTFGTSVSPSADAVRLKMWLVNGSDQALSGLRVQNCAMLWRAAGFASQSNDNKLFQPPYAAVRNEAGNEWIIFAWRPALRTWGNTRVPCLHSDPQFPDCPPGARRELHGWLSFYSGRDIQQELQRIEGLAWWENDHEK